jgi:hypothetical protein
MKKYPQKQKIILADNCKQSTPIIELFLERP